MQLPDGFGCSWRAEGQASGLLRYQRVWHKDLLEYNPNIYLTTEVPVRHLSPESIFCLTKTALGQPQLPPFRDLKHSDPRGFPAPQVVPAPMPPHKSCCTHTTPASPWAVHPSSAKNPKQHHSGLHTKWNQSVRGRELEQS